jgi:hypothetical protein
MLFRHAQHNLVMQEAADLFGYLQGQPQDPFRHPLPSGGLAQVSRGFGERFGFTLAISRGVSACVQQAGG